MRGRFSKTTPKFSTWFTLCAVSILLGFTLNIGACGPPASSEEVAVDGSASEGSAKTETTPEKKPEDSVKEDPPKEDPPKEDPPKEDPPKEDPPKDEKPPSKGSGDINEAKASASNARAPLDASPSPDGKTIYYTAYQAAKDPTTNQSSRSNEADPTKNKDPFAQNTGKQDGALYSVPAAGGSPKVLATGFWSPTGLVVSKDGSKVYVADSNVSDPTSEKTGAIYTVDSSGGGKKVLSGTEGYQPKSLDVVTETNDQIYFTGVDPTTGKPGVFRVAASGGTVTTVFTPGSSEEFFKDPGGIAVTADRTIYVAETIGGMGGNSSSVIQIKAGKATEFVTGIKVGYPAGIALSQDEKYLLVSGLKRNKNTAVVYRIDRSDAKKIQEISTKSIEDKTNSGGLHRAHNADIYAWSDAAWPDEDGKNGGTVFLLTTKK